MQTKAFNTFIALFICFWSFGQSTYSMKLGKLKYRGGGDWYANPTSLPNLIKFCNENLGTFIDPNEVVVDVASPDLMQLPFVHMTGHGTVVFSREDAQNLRKYLIGGGFLHIDDNYGMDKFVRTELKKVFPELELKPLPANHAVFNQKFKFPAGLPKIHEHDGKPAQAFALVWENRVVCIYTYETDLGDGWEDAAVHNNPPEVRLKALQMGANLVQFAFIQ